MHDKRGFMAMLFGASLLLTAGCDDGEDSLGEETQEPYRYESDGGEQLGCALNETIDDCMADLGCSPMYAHALHEDDNGGWCTETTPRFIGCVSTLDLCDGSGKFPCEDPCPAVGEIVCEGDSYWRTTGCVPGDLAICEAPGEITGDC